MIITVDCRMINSSGIGVYLRGCLPWFLNSDNGFILLGDPAEISPLVSGRSNAAISACTVKPFSPRELFFFPRSLLRKINGTDLYYSPFFNIPGGIRIPVYTSIHDIIFPDMPELVSPPGLFVRMFFFRRAAAGSKKIFTVSRFSKSRIEHFLGGGKEVIVTHSAVQPLFLSSGKRDLQKTETIVFIGNIKKHKGLDILLEAFAEAKKNGLRHKLVIAGSAGNFKTRDNEILRKIETAADLEFTGFVSDEKLARLLSEAALLVQPSLYEGFGLPPLEAMALGTKALVSDIPVFREIYSGFPVTFFRAGDSADLKAKMESLLLDKKPEVIRLPEELAEKYTFEKTASVILRELN
ncbi:MAG: glycosyltransferase family 4 protein [Treponema sp.]|jgi:glycosyltransferase involved in cell wall biosynthesis|nr:glycosyltransferase family 4 protein [Treponema sp.]